MNTITDLLDLEDPDIFISDIIIEDGVKTITVETRPSVRFCPVCGFRMHSRGIKKRKINHPVLQDHYRLVIILKQRRWRCTNPACSFEAPETFRFVNKYRRNTNATDLLIVDAFRDLSATAAGIAERFHTSDTYVNEVFDRYVRLDRLPLSDAVSVDEVYLDMDAYCKYALVIQDFRSGDTIDLLRSRRSNVTEPYFAAIPKEERFAVKYLISDMYNPYLEYVNKYFPNAVSVVDAFHVIQWITHSIDLFLRSLLKTFRERDRVNNEIRSYELSRPVYSPPSDEVYLLQKYRWIILMNRSAITYHSDLRLDKHFRYLMNTYDYERLFLGLHPDLPKIRELKELYIEFNERNAGDPVRAASELDLLIERYLRCGIPMFKDFALLLRKYRAPIINSFIMIEKIGPGGLYDSRLSNGPIESLNRKIKDLKRSGRGFRNFDHFRNRFLFASRSSPVINGSKRTDLITGSGIEDEL